MVANAARATERMGVCEQACVLDNVQQSVASTVKKKKQTICVLSYLKKASTREVKIKGAATLHGICGISCNVLQATSHQQH